ncbi:MAG: hypothetical protein K2X57_03465 [Xanthobacteraceae bacterium]|nr:hypothetical protein [Xanthobacteraceae bacterium]MBY0611233.1 hypothetical protein [Beijerinckiaceae bacterium]
MTKRPRTDQPIKTPLVAIFASQKSAGKTHAATFLCDVFAVNNFAFQAFQIDDQKRLAHMIGDVVTDLRPDPDLLIEDPTLAMRAIGPFYEAAREAIPNNRSVILDTGANMVETLTNFLREVDFGEDLAAWNLPAIAFVPFLPLDPESTSQAAFTVGRLRGSLPTLRIVLVENRFGGSADRIVAGSIAETNYRRLCDVASGTKQIIMPGIPREYWAPFEGAGIRFVKALAMDPAETSVLLGRSIAEVKVMRSSILRFWTSMHGQFAELIDLPKGGRS